MNTIGTLFRLTTFGESHGPAIGGVIDGMPSCIPVDFDELRREMARRRPGQSAITTARKETDEVEILSGIFEGQTTGAPIGFIIRNTDQHSNDYKNLRHVFRPSHADFTYDYKYSNRDYRGGGRASARETAARCVAGYFAKTLLQKYEVSVHAYTSSVGNIALPHDYTCYDLSKIEANAVRCPDPEVAAQMVELIRQVHSEGDSIGGTITCVALGTPPGWGSPIYGKLNAALAAAVMSINAAKGIEFGSGFAGAAGRGSEQNDAWTGIDADFPERISNNSGGIEGGISNGEDIYFRVAFKPTPTILRDQQTVNDDLQLTTLKARGRHDPCVLPRAVPVVEAMTAITLADHLLQDQAFEDS